MQARIVPPPDKLHLMKILLPGVPDGIFDLKYRTQMARGRRKRNRKPPCQIAKPGWRMLFRRSKQTKRLSGTTKQEEWLS
jgi:hypothetical protein